MATPEAIGEPAAMGGFERHLSAWVAACIVAGIALGHGFPGVFAALAGMEVARVNLPVAGLVWLMIVPMLLKIDFAALGGVAHHWRGIGLTLFVNWAVKPFSMALLAWLFVRVLFAPLLPADQLNAYVAGLILLAAAPCTAMVFVWANLCRGDPAFTLSQVALNDAIMVVAFGPIVGLLLGLASITVPWDTLLLSVALYVVVPLLGAQALRSALIRRGPGALDAVADALKPLSLGALLATLVLLFGFQGEAILAQPTIIALLAVPILVQVYLNAGLAPLADCRLSRARCRPVRFHSSARAVSWISRRRRPSAPSGSGRGRRACFRASGREGRHSRPQPMDEPSFQRHMQLPGAESPANKWDANASGDPHRGQSARACLPFPTTPARPDFLAALHVTHALDDASVTYAHQVDAPHGLGKVRSPAITPADHGPLLCNQDLFKLEARRRVFGKRPPDLEASGATPPKLAVRTGLGILEHALFGDQVIEQLRRVALKRLVEPVDHLPGRGCDGLDHGVLRSWRNYARPSFLPSDVRIFR